MRKCEAQYTNNLRLKEKEGLDHNDRAVHSAFQCWLKVGKAIAKHGEFYKGTKQTKSFKSKSNNKK